MTTTSRVPFTRTLAGLLMLGGWGPLPSEAAADADTFVIHGRTKSCADITQLDSALTERSQQFFAGWTEQDYADAAAWSRACASYGWHVPGRPRLPLLQAQHDGAMGSAQVQLATAPPAVAAASALGGAAAAAPAVSGVHTTPYIVPSTSASPLPSGAATSVDRAGASDTLLTDDYVNKHFHEESVWVAKKAGLDIGADTGPEKWSTGGTAAQLKNRLTADKIVLYCTKHSSTGEVNERPLQWDWRRCEGDEASAYGRLVSDNEFPAAGRGVVLGCVGLESYVHMERCIETLVRTGTP